MRALHLPMPRLGMAAAVSIAVVALMPVVGGWQIARTREVMLADATRNAGSLSRLLAQDTARLIRSVDLLLLDVAERVERGDTGLGVTGLGDTGLGDTELGDTGLGQTGLGDRGLAAFAAVRAGRLGAGIAVEVVDAAGAVRAGSVPEAWPAGLAAAAIAWHRDHPGPEAHVGRMTALGGGARALPISRRIDTDGVFAGVAVATVSAAALDPFYRTLGVGPNGAATLWSDDGRLLVRYPPSPAEAGEVLNRELRARLGAQPAGVATGVSPVDGVRRIFAYDAVAGAPLAVSASIAVDDVLGAWWREAELEIAFLIGSCLILTVFAWALERNRRHAEWNAGVSRRTDRLYRILAENSTDLVLLMGRHAPDLLYVSPSVMALTGWSAEEFGASPLERHLHPDDIAGVRAALAGLSPAQPTLTAVHRLRVKSGPCLWVEAVAHLSSYDALGPCVVYTARDVTARRHAEEALSTSEARYRMLTDMTGDVVTQLDLNFKRIYVSPASRVLLGYAPEELVGVRPSGTIHPEDAARAREAAVDLVAGRCEGDRTTVTHRVLHKEGHYVWVEAGMNLVRDVLTGAPKSVICALRDVTERQRTAQHLEAARAEAETAARQQSEFVANMSHELRTPLTAILGIQDLMAGDPGLSAQNRRYLGLARDAGETLLAIINDVLDLSKIDVGLLHLDSVAFDVPALVEDCRSLVDVEASKRALRLMVATDSPRRLVGDPARIKQVLLNLMSNAVKFTQRGVVATRLHYSEAAARLRIEVTDTGIGIAAETLPRLFERFSQADTSVTRSYGGTGLGLAICKRLVELMGGRIGAISEPGHGSTFWLELPLAAARDGGAETSEPAPGAPRSGRRVLLAEDNVLSQEVITTMLQRHGHSVSAVEDGAAAAAAAAGAFEVILMDIQMPVMDGLTATRAIRAAGIATPIVGLTANALVEDVTKCLGAGMQAHVAKPIDWGHLLAVIDRVAASRPDAGPATDTRADTRADIRAGSDADRGPQGHAAAGDGERHPADPAGPGADVLDESKLATLAGLVGPERLARMLKSFVGEVETRTAGADALAAQELSARMHTLVSLAGQFGFTELSDLCASIEAEIRADPKPVRVAEFKAAAARAVTAAARTRYARDTADVAA